ncbi:MAG: multifunctional oxoglutarate decarboxylase/oxoglutarate dehydrogenase thiamine pyrophosphate-binding subunit/dihydrolipoyllysine-residue succinyltransferase subunit [Propionibacteriaceae bacterium]|nr:multifunctional oxoglutarate decarboxylase/oxoglutarate dehydrogenase thiamine pyrophosphate-binding subunit/dihydrolipoyllysine-residue succinyltransferase subunit [Propionibacteriaceae bacterium]
MNVGDRATFGDNEWLIASMRRRFDADPSSVGADWAAFFGGGTTADAANTEPSPQESLPVVADRPPTGGPLSADMPEVRPAETPNALTFERLRGARLATVGNMTESLQVPTATSFRAVPMKLVIEQRATINNFLRRTRGGKVSFTHLVAFALIQAIKDTPVMNDCFTVVDGQPTVRHNPSINLGVAIDLNTGPDRTLVVPVIRGCEAMNFGEFWRTYEDVVGRAKAGTAQADDMTGATVSITNVGAIGTMASRPRLMAGQGTILGIGSIDYPAPFGGTAERRLADFGVSKSMTISSTYDHRIIMGAQSGEFLGRIHALLLGADGFYDDIFESLRVPYPALHWATDSAEPGTNRDALVASLIAAYRQFGHLQADIDPLEYRTRTHPDLELEAHGLTLWDLDRQFQVLDLGGEGTATLTLRQVLDLLRDSYCHTIGIEYTYIQDPDQRLWWRSRVEMRHTPRATADQLRILNELIEAEVFETFLQTKYVGQTRFSLEGAESVMVLLAELCEQAADNCLDEVCIGMPHRGRLNVLTNIVGKALGQVFREFDHRAPTWDDISGDVTYHLGNDGSYVAASGRSVRCSVAANPSHLEAVDPVLEGIARAKIDHLGDPDGTALLPVLMHGDASFAGQGVVYETLQMSTLKPYSVGGTIHIVVNNQLGFTTAPSDARSSVYCTDVAKVVQAPVLHVNGDDPDACARAAELAFAYRAQFHRDIVIDLMCYRRRGHNEGDDPGLTQPLMYDLIEQKKPVRTIFTSALIGRGEITTTDAEAAATRFRARLEEVFNNVRDPAVPPEPDEYRSAPRYPDKKREKAASPVTQATMDAVADAYASLPDGFSVHPRLAPQLTRRAEAIRNGPVDWASAELLAFGSLLMEGHRVRLVGQDTRRGTFSQRFGAIVDRVTNQAWVPLKHLSDDQAPFEIFDGILNEYAAMGFEYGYSVAAPDALVCWEAQYGDFANGGQTIIDEFISSGQTKWGQESGVVLLLPHGYEGAGPDHSSARIERYLASCCDTNMTVAQPSTAASYFHLLRTHTLVGWHHPLVVVTPKSMLRNRLADSPTEDFINGTWHPVLADSTVEPTKVRRVLLCSGKMRWDLVAERARRGLDAKVAIIAVERLHPVPREALIRALKAYHKSVDVVWVQEEPINQGPWPYLAEHLPAGTVGIGRPPSGAPAAGSPSANAAQASALLDEVFS